MTEQEELELEKIMEKDFPLDITWEEMIKRQEKYKGHKLYENILLACTNDLIDSFTVGYFSYGDNPFKYEKGSLIDLCMNNIEKISKEHAFYWAFYYYMKHEYDQCIKMLKKRFAEYSSNGLPITEVDFLADFLVPYKDAPASVWDCIVSGIKKANVESGVMDYCVTSAKYYATKDINEQIDLLGKLCQMHPELKSPKEWLGYCYCQAGMWNNVIACLETVEATYLLAQVDLYFDLAWAHGKVKEYKEEAEYYQKALELDKTIPFALNNYGYAIYKQKKYQAARDVFMQCIEEKKDMPYAGNNYVKCLLALGRYKDAKDFIKSTDLKISKTIQDQVKKKASTNQRLKKETEEVAEEFKDSEVDSQAEPKNSAKIEQFSNEKLLEDELTARIESGVPVFGLNLKIYRRKGEYGRQYIIPIGRLDLLCEDDKGNLYIIELKKDSGYDDAYVQTAAYLDWFASSKKFKERKCFGIICLNNPSQELLDKVHKDNRMKVYEYQISYTER